jgi:hypothetical protein
MKLDLRFEGPSLLQNKIKFFYSRFNENKEDDGLYISIPIGVYTLEDSLYNRKPLFVDNFTAKLTTLDIGEYFEGEHSIFPELFFKKYFPESKFLKKLQKIGKQWISKDKPDPTPAENNAEAEFIEVDEDSSFCGNYTQDGKEGCHMIFGNNPHCIPLTNLVVSAYVNKYTFKELENVELYGKSSEETCKILLEKIGLKRTVEAFKEGISRDLNHSIDEYHGIYRIFLSGNDDDSWTKYFYTEEDMMEEVYRLRRRQPINKRIDVEKNGYYFTN